MARTQPQQYSIRTDFATFIHNLLTLGEDVLVSWANENLEIARDDGDRHHSGRAPRPEKPR